MFEDVRTVLKNLLGLPPTLPRTYRQRFGEVFVEAQRVRAARDGLTIAQSTPRVSDRAILRAYHKEREKLKDPHAYRMFVEQYFALPDDAPTPTFTGRPQRTFEEHLAHMWNVLTRGPDRRDDSSLLPLPRRYIVPGGRFREIYYWDSYFTMLGLKESGRSDLIEDMVENFAHLIRTYGFIPNGTRVYYLTRSNPPFFPLMVKLASNVKGDPALPLRYLREMETEYRFFMRGARRLMRHPNQQAHEHVVRTPQGFLNRFYASSRYPREEMLADDVELAQADIGEHPLYHEFQTVCESGWDFSSRWLLDSEDRNSSHILDLVPVDLNSLLAVNEALLAEVWRTRGNDRKAREYALASRSRSEAIRSLMWNEEAGWFVDYDAVEGTQTTHLTLAGMYPLFSGIATDEMAKRAAATLSEHFLKEGGLVTTLRESGEQWDAPNGWAPLQYIAAEGLERYGHHELAHEVRRRFTTTCRTTYERLGVMLEKYNVMNVHAALPTDKDYGVQEGFGWTNGVVLNFLAREQEQEHPFAQKSDPMTRA